MAESADLHDWELLQNSDSDDKPMPFEEIIQLDYFAIDRSMPFPTRPQIELGPEENVFFGENSENFGPESDKGDSFLVDHREMEVGLEGIDPSLRISAGGDSFLPGVSKLEVGFQGMESGMKNCDGIHAGEGEGFGPETEKGELFFVNETELGVGLDGIDPDHQNSYAAGDREELVFGGAEESERDELGSDSNIEMNDSESVSVGDEEKKGLVWWKQPVEILKLFVFRMRPIWSIPIAAAVIGIVLMSRRLYRMKHKSRRIPLKVSFEDKKATAKFLVSAARLNEAVVRRVPAVRSPLLLANGVSPWPLVGLL